MLDIGLYPLASQPGSCRTVLHVKLTDSVIQRLEEHNNLAGNKRAMLEFKGKTGTLHLPRMTGNGQDCFNFALSEIETFANNQAVCKLNKDKHFEKVGVVEKDVIRFEASGDSFSKVGEQFRNIQSEKEKQSTVLLDDQIRRMKQINHQPKSVFVPKKRKYSEVESRADSYRANKERKVAPKCEQNTKPISPHVATPTVHDQGYGTDSEDANSEKQTKDEENGTKMVKYNLLYKDISSDFLLKYKPITSNSQRNVYKNHFDLEYPKYLKIHKILEERYTRFKHSEELHLKNFSFSENQSSSVNYKNYVKNFKYLHDKLRYLKFCVKTYDFSAH